MEGKAVGNKVGGLTGASEGLADGGALGATVDATVGKISCERSNNVAATRSTTSFNRVRGKSLKIIFS